MAKFYVTTPIYYINDKPHVGHAYSTIAADVLARWQRGKGSEVLFSAGVDENAQKTVQAAEAAGQNPAEYTKRLSDLWEQTWQKLGISNDHFIRTTSKPHYQAVYDFFKLVKPDDIYKGNYEGLYCVGHEAFLKESELVDGKCPDHNTKPELVKEENYFFKLTNYQKPLLDHLKKHPEFIQPVSRRNEVKTFIEGGLEDFSISRATQKWGIPYPGDDQQVVYVWFDALINYLTVAGFPQETYTKWWPADVHIVGKDIIRFHCVYWPAMLLSAGIELPKTIYAHGFFTIDGQKISKSLGNAIDPVELAEQFGNDALRYYLLREIPFGADGDFSHQRFAEVYNSDLANDLGNLVQRTASMISRYLGGEIGEVEPHSHDVGIYEAALQKFQFDKALAEVWLMIKGLNQLVEEEKPWVLAKSDEAHLKEVLHHLVADLLQVAQLLLPFMPETAEKITKTFAGGKIDKSIGILFPRQELTESGSTEITETEFEPPK